ncbi:hypothetical protein DDE82_001746 [Stemphylium lycopersici]|nr:hypothetical protein DDE82_001746 [Stemphylium lycopersici]
MTPHKDGTLSNLAMGTKYTSPVAFNACPPNQQPVGILAGCQVHPPPLSMELQLELALEDDRHSLNRRQILERAGAFSTIPPQQQLMGPYDCPSLDTIPNLDFSTLASRMNHAHRNPDLACHGSFSAYDGSELYGSDAEAWNQQNASQVCTTPFLLNDGAPESMDVVSNFFGTRNLDLKASSIATNFQQPVTAALPLLPRSHNPPIATLNPHGLPPPSSQPGTLYHDDSTQLSFVQNGRADASQPSAFPVLDPFCGMTSFPAPLPDENMYSQSSFAPRMEQSDACALPGHVSSATTPSVRPLLPASSAPSRARRITAKRNRARVSPYPGVSRETHSSECRSETLDRPLDNMHFYQNPTTERKYNKTQPRSRKVDKKIVAACFGCRLRKKAFGPVGWITVAEKETTY